jgi:hypothetical protein
MSNDAGPSPLGAPVDHRGVGSEEAVAATA